MIKIKTVGKKVQVVSPYHPNWPKKAKNLGGRYDGSAWEFDVRDEERVRALCREIYGTDGSSVDLVTVQIDMDKAHGASGKSWFRFGREILSRTGRDVDVRLGHGVVLLAGGFKASGGSARYPAIDDPKPGTVLEVRDVPRALVEGDDLEIVDEELIDSVTVAVSGNALAALRAMKDGPLAPLTHEEIVAAALALYTEHVSARS